MWGGKFLTDRLGHTYTDNERNEYDATLATHNNNLSRDLWTNRENISKLSDKQAVYKEMVENEASSSQPHNTIIGENSQGV